jgi:diguanylate cyclase (GGDEF)-like protein
VGSGGWQPVAGSTEAPNGRKASSWRAFSARDSDRDDQAVVIADAMAPFCGIGCVLFALVSATQFAFDKTPGAWWSSALAALTSIVLGVAFVLLRSGRGEFMRQHSLPFGAFVGALVGLNPIVYIFGTQITYPAIGVLLVIVAVGGLVHDWVWAAVVILAIDVVWILCAVAWGIPVPPATFISQILKANALAMVLNVARTRTVLRFEQARLEVHRMATTDELTGLANQRGLLEVAREYPDKLAGQPLDLAVVYVDVDGLKAVNDTLGHAAGDALIRSVADVLRRAFRPIDTIARVGGDEFAILLRSPNPQLAQTLVDRVHEHLAEVGVSASIGTASSTPGASQVDLADLLQRADAAMYAVKAVRKNGQA